MAGYKGFGSFHSDNIEDLIRLPKGEHTPPPTPEVVVRARDRNVRELARFGRDLKKSEFLLGDEWRFVNHGAFGAALKAAVDEANAWRKYIEEQPLKFIDRELFPFLVETIEVLSRWLHVPMTDVALLPHVTSGLNAVIQSQKFEEGDTMYMLDIGYGSLKKMLRRAADDTGAIVQMEHVGFPLVDGAAGIVNLVKRTLKRGTKLAVFDVITSNTAIRMPVEELTAYCREIGVPVLLDAAHSLGQVDIDVGALQPDWFLTNGHKWFCAPKGVAVMYVHPSRQDSTRPTIVSHGWGSGLCSEFVWDGCRDYTPALVVPSIDRFWKRVGVGNAHRYCKKLLADAVEKMTDILGTDTLVPLDMCGFMALVRIPDSSIPPFKTPQPTSTEAKIIQDGLHYSHRTECPVKCIEGKLYVRISAMVYNSVDEYVALARIIKAARHGDFDFNPVVAASSSRLPVVALSVAIGIAFFAASRR